MKTRVLLGLAVSMVAFVGVGNWVCGQLSQDDKPRKISKTEAEWRKQLTRDQYYVTRLKGTEPAFSGKLLHTKSAGSFLCVGCGAELFESRAKFNSGTGWPSFWKPVKPEALDSEWDYRGGMPRMEVMCMECGAHLGHVFSDGPPPTGLRFCINSVALKFQRAGAASAKSKTQSEDDSKAKNESQTPEASSKSEDPAGQPSPDAEKSTPKSKSPSAKAKSRSSKGQ